MGGLTSRELLALVRALPPDQIVAADLVEVSPPYDHAEITSLAAATLGYEITSLMARAGGGA
jgi:agmatinase